MNGAIFRPYAYIYSERGGATIFGLFLTIMFLILGGFAIDSANGYREHARMQMVADIAATAAAQHIPEMRLLDAGSVALADKMDVIKQDAINFANANMDFSQNGALLTPSDIRFGYLDEASGQTPKPFAEITAAGDPERIDVVRVSVKRMQSRGNRLRLNFMSIVGREPLNISAVSIVTARDGPELCGDSVFFAHTDYLEFKSKSGYGSYDMDGTHCFYSNSQIKFYGKDIIPMNVSEDIRLVAPNGSIDFYNWAQATFDHPTLTNSEIRALLPFALTVPPQNPTTLVQNHWDRIWLETTGKSTLSYGPSTDDLFPDALWESGGSLTVTHFASSAHTFSVMDVLGDYSIYRVQDSGDPNKGKFIFDFNNSTEKTISNAVFIAPKGIEVKNGTLVRFENTFIITKGDVLFYGDVTVGSDTACSTGFFDSYVMGNNVKFETEGNSYSLFGVFAAAINDFYAKDKISMNYQGVYAEGGKVKVKGFTTITACLRQLEGIFPVSRPDVPQTTVSGLSRLIR